MSNIQTKQEFIEWHKSIKDQSVRQKFKDLVTTVSPEAASNFAFFINKDKYVPDVKGETKDQTRYRLINEWISKLDVMSHDEAEPADEARGDITDITEMPETEVVNDITEAADVADVEVTPTVSEASDPSDYLGPHAQSEPQLSPQPEWQGSTSRVEANLINALSSFVASLDSPPEDTADGASKDAILKLGKIVHEQGETIAKLEKKVKSLFNALRDE